MDPSKYNSSDDVLMTEVFLNTISEEEKSTIQQITTHFKQKISKDIEDMAKLISNSAELPNKKQALTFSNHEFEKYKAISKIQNSVLFITNLIHKSQ